MSMDAPQHGKFLKDFLGVQNSVYAYIRSAGFGTAEAEDISQDVALALWKSYSSYDSSRPFVAWANRCRKASANKIIGLVELPRL